MKWKPDFHSFGRRISRLSWWVFILAAILIVGRMALPFAVKALVNHQLSKAHDYTGKIGDVEIKLWRGGYRIDQIQILKKAATSNRRFFPRRKSIFRSNGGNYFI